MTTIPMTATQTLSLHESYFAKAQRTLDGYTVLSESPYEMVKEFHEKFEVPVGVSLETEDTEKLERLRLDLITEEYAEVVKEFKPYFYDEETGHEGFDAIDAKKLTKELSDLMYVVIGTAVTFGLPLEEVFKEVHKSNMSKLDENGKVIKREDGKVLKGPNYKEPELERFFK